MKATTHAVAAKSNPVTVKTVTMKLHHFGPRVGKSNYSVV